MVLNSDRGRKITLHRMAVVGNRFSFNCKMVGCDVRGEQEVGRVGGGRAL